MGLDSAILRRHCREIVGHSQIAWHFPIIKRESFFSFLDINRKFCESFHLKVFGKALYPNEPDNEQDQPMDNYDVASIHTDTSAGGKERSFSRATSIASITSRANSRLESSRSLDPLSGLTDADHHGDSSVENSFSRKSSVNNIHSRDPLPRAKSTANSSQLFKNRQVGFTRTNSSYLSATANGSVSIVMGKRKTMIVPFPPNKLPRAERKVSGGMIINLTIAASGLLTLSEFARRINSQKTSRIERLALS